MSMSGCAHGTMSFDVGLLAAKPPAPESAIHTEACGQVKSGTGR